MNTAAGGPADTSPWQASATAQGAVCLFTSIGEPQSSGTREIVTVTQSLDLTETVTVTATGTIPPDRTGRSTGPVISVTVVDRARGTVRSHDPEQPDDPSVGPVVRAVTVIVDRYRKLAPDSLLPQVEIRIGREIPAGVLACADADAAATLAAMRDILHGRDAVDHGLAPVPGPDDSELRSLASLVGPGVPARFIGGTVLDKGSGPVPVMTRGVRHWAFATDDRSLAAEPLSVEKLVAGLDSLREAANRGERVYYILAGSVTHIQRALLDEDPTVVGGFLDNDLHALVCSFRPGLRLSMNVAVEAEALGVVVSGAEPTLAVLCADRDHAVEVAAAVAGSGHAGPTLVASSSPHGVRSVP